MDPRFLLDTNICIYIRQEKRPRCCSGFAGCEPAKRRFR